MGKKTCLPGCNIKGVKILPANLKKKVLILTTVANSFKNEWALSDESGESNS